MSERTEAAIQNPSPVHEGIARTVAPTIKTREDLDGCGCLECRNIETATVHRTVLDTLVWSLRLFRSSPSIVVFAGITVAANRLLETDGIDALPTPAIGGFEILTTFAFVFLLRAYVATVVAGELTDNRVTVRDGLYRSVARIPALIGLVVLLLLSMMIVFLLLSLPLLVLVALVPGNPVEVVGFPVAAAVGGIVFVVPFLFLVFKFWFAPEACVLGRYGPVKSLRISWRITTNYRTKFLLVALIGTGSAVGLYLPEYLPEVGTGLASVTPVLNAISASVGELLSVVWASAYAHIYVQGIVD